jgi:hypothetical protein
MQKFFSNYPLQNQLKRYNMIFSWWIVGLLPAVAIHSTIFKNEEKAILAFGKTRVL